MPTGFSDRGPSLEQIREVVREEVGASEMRLTGRMYRLDKRMDSLEGRLSKFQVWTEHRSEQVDRRFEQIESRLDGVESQVRDMRGVVNLIGGHAQCEGYDPQSKVKGGES